MRRQDEMFMRRALAQAWLGRAGAGASPIGCVIMRDGQVLAEGFNEVDLRHDCTAHAEIVVMRAAGARLGDAELRGATLYSTLQPCGMCSMAAIWSKISRVVYGAGRGDVHRMYFEAWHVDTLDFFRDAVRGGIEVVGGVLAAECIPLYYRPDDHPPAREQGNI